MKIVKNKETLILSTHERDLLDDAWELINNIYHTSEPDGEIESYADNATDNIKWLLEIAETEDK